MGLIDTIILDKHYQCPACGKEITSLQTKEFEPFLQTYRIGNCISHPDDVRITREELFCNSCKKVTNGYAYIVVDRGILIGTTSSLEAARSLLGTLNNEKLLLLYHSVCKKIQWLKGKRNKNLRFLDDLCTWYGEKDKSKRRHPIGSLLRETDFNGVEDPIVALKEYVTYEEMITALDTLEENGQTILDIYYVESVKEGEESWSINVHQEQINRLCGFNWAWTILGKKQDDIDKEKRKGKAPSTIVVNKPFTEQAVVDAMGQWLGKRGYTFVVNIIEPKQSDGQEFKL
jgi:hypothetical protein